LKEHPRTGTGQPELLKYDLAGYYSRRINRKHRLVLWNQRWGRYCISLECSLTLRR